MYFLTLGSKDISKSLNAYLTDLHLFFMWKEIFCLDRDITFCTNMQKRFSTFIRIFCFGNLTYIKAYILVCINADSVLDLMQVV